MTNRNNTVHMEGPISVTAVECRQEGTLTRFTLCTGPSFMGGLQQAATLGKRSYETLAFVLAHQSNLKKIPIVLGPGRSNLDFKLIAEMMTDPILVRVMMDGFAWTEPPSCYFVSNQITFYVDLESKILAAQLIGPLEKLFTDAMSARLVTQSQHKTIPVGLAKKSAPPLLELRFPEPDYDAAFRS